MVQTGFVKIVSNPAFSPRAVSPKQAIDALNISIQSSTHQFWSDDISVSDVLRIVKGRVAGHQQVNDAYLVALAVQHGGRLATLDRSIAQLGPSDAVEEVT